MGATVRGVEVVPVRVEVVVSGGLPGMAIVGMPDAAIQEARERVRAALRAAGFSMPGEKIVVNLAPSHLRKTGSGFDLPIALGILAATGQIDPAWARDALYVGEALAGWAGAAGGGHARLRHLRPAPRAGLRLRRRQRSGALRRRAAARYDVAGPGGP